MQYHRTGDFEQPEPGQWHERGDGTPMQYDPDWSIGKRWILRVEEAAAAEAMDSVSGFADKSDLVALNNAAIKIAKREREARLKAEEALKQLQDALSVQYHQRLKAEDDVLGLQAQLRSAREAAGLDPDGALGLTAAIDSLRTGATHLEEQRDALQARIDRARAKLEESGLHKEKQLTEESIASKARDAWRILARKEADAFGEGVSA